MNGAAREGNVQSTSPALNTGLAPVLVALELVAHNNEPVVGSDCCGLRLKQPVAGSHCGGGHSDDQREDAQ